MSISSNTVETYLRAAVWRSARVIMSASFISATYCSARNCSLNFWVLEIIFLRELVSSLDDVKWQFLSEEYPTVQKTMTRVFSIRMSLHFELKLTVAEQKLLAFGSRYFWETLILRSAYIVIRFFFQALFRTIFCDIVRNKELRAKLEISFKIQLSRVVQDRTWGPQ